MSKTMPRKLTPRQQEILDFIRCCIADKYPPTLSEIAEGFEFSVKAALDHLVAIEKKGHIQRMPNIPRGIFIIDDPASDKNAAAPPEYLTIEITPEMVFKVKGFRVGEYIRIRRQSVGNSGDIVLVEDVNGTLILHRLMGHVRGILGKVVGHTFVIG